MQDPETGYDDYEDCREAFEARLAEERESGPMNAAKWTEFEMFLAALNSDELAHVTDLADAAWDRANAAERAICTVPALPGISRKAAKAQSVACIGNGLYVRTGKRGA
jgi:hypothetical protein